MTDMMTDKMPPKIESGRTSMESHEKPERTSNPAFQWSDEEVEAQQPGLDELTIPSRIATRASNRREGAPLEYTSSHISIPAQPDIPNGGTTAWLQVLCGFFQFFNTWGLINTFGVFQTYYSTTLIPEKTNSDISWIGSVQAFLLCCCTVFAGPLFDRGYALTIVRTGSVMVVFGMMMTSLCDQYWQLMLAQGVCAGIGAGAVFIVAVAIIPSYFTTRRALATGIAASGSSLGGIIYPIIFHRLEPRIGFAWSTRIIGFIALVTLIIPCTLLRPRNKPAPRKQIIDFSGFREPPFAAFSLAVAIAFLGLYVPFFYIQEFASEVVGLDSTWSFYLLPILSAGSMPGRILPGFIAPRVGVLNILATCIMLAGVLGFSWMSIHQYAPLAGIIIWCLLYGAFSGAMVSLQPPTVVSITDDMSTVGGRLGMNTFCCAVGILIGTPIAGVIVGKAGWVGLQAFGGGTMMAGGLLVAVTRGLRVGWDLKAVA